MKIIDVKQGSPEWHAHRATHFNASEAPAMMGASKYTTRTELLRIKAGGEAAEVNSFQQAAFDRGHATEALARPIIEDMFGIELFPVVGESDEDPRMAASYDGLTMDEETGYEHKLWNEALAESVRNGSLRDDPNYFWQMEHHFLVCPKLKRIIFTVSDGTADNLETLTYEPVPGRREQLIAGWEQLASDLENYTHRDAPVEVFAEPVMSLPTLVYKINGTALSTNLDVYKQAAAKLVEESKLPLKNDQDFANREALCKAFKEAEDKIALVCEQVVGEFKDVSTFIKELEQIGSLIRQARLNGEKQVKTRKDAIREEIRSAADGALNQHIRQLNESLGGRVTLPAYRADFNLAMKNKKTIKSIQDAVDTALANAKVECTAMAGEIKDNLISLDEHAQNHGFLFHDLQQIITKPNDDFVMLVQARVLQHEKAEEARREAERERIRKEDADKLAREQAAAELAAAQKATDGADLSPAAQALNEQQGAERFSATHRIPTTLDPVASVLKRKTMRPSEADLVKTIASAYMVTTAQAAQWLVTMDMAAIADMAEGVTA